MTRHFSSVVLAIVFTGAAVRASQTGADLEKILALGKTGRSAEAWRMWAEQPKTPPVLRLGIALAIETKQLQRGIDLYTELATQQQQADRAVLTDLALAAAEDVSTSIDSEARILACGAAVGLRGTHKPCREMLSTLASRGSDADERAWAVYALADAGVPPGSGDMNVAESTMSKSMRTRIVQTMVHMPPGERVRLLEPLLEETNQAAQYGALLLLGDIPGDEALRVLRSAQARLSSGPPKVATMLGLARHGDRPSVDELADLLPSLGAYERIQAARALARLADVRGLAALEAALRSPVDIDRLTAADAVRDIDPDQARRVVLDSLTGGSPAVRQRALVTAGMLELGTDRAVYRWLSDVSPLVRSAAIAAIRETFTIQDARRKTDPR